MPSLAKLQLPAFIMENQQPVLGRHYFYTAFMYLYVSFYAVISLSQIEFQQYWDTFEINTVWTKRKYGQSSATFKFVFFLPEKHDYMAH